MRFMMLMCPGVYQGEAGAALQEGFSPPADDVERMMRFNAELSKAGALVSLDGFHPPAQAVRVSFAGGRPEMASGPVSGTGAVVGGYWMIRADSMDDAVAWARRVPASEGDAIEIRQVWEMEDFPPDVRQAAADLAGCAEVQG